MSFSEEMVQCPYNAHHIILKSRFIVHLCKCRKQYGGTQFSTCPFNATHSILTPELQYHVSVCPDRKKLDSHLYVVADENKRKYLEPTNIEVTTSENWEDEPQMKISYLDVKDNLIMKKPLLRLPAGKSKAQRREFFASEIQRFQSVGRGDEMSYYFDNETKQNLPSSSGSSGGAIRKKFKEIESEIGKQTVDSDDDDDDDNTFAIVLKNRGRGRGLLSSTTQTH